MCYKKIEIWMQRNVESEGDVRTQGKMDAGIRVIHRQAKECQGAGNHQKLGGRQETCSPSGAPEGNSPANTLILYF